MISVRDVARAAVLVATGLLCTFCSPQAVTAESYVSVGSWGTAGTGDGMFNLPTYLAVDSTSQALYVSDQDNHRVQKFELDGDFLMKWATTSLPTGIGLGLDGYLYIGGQGPPTFGKFTDTGAPVLSWNTPQPTGVAVNPTTGDIYVGDNLNGRIHAYTSTGTSLGDWAVGHQRVHSIAFDSSQNLYVADEDAKCIKVYTPSGTLLSQWGSFGDPCGVAVDESGYVYVADWLNNRIGKYTGGGTLVTEWGSAGSGLGQLDKPLGVAVDNAGFVYVSECGNNRIQKFAPVPEPVTMVALLGGIGCLGSYLRRRRT